MVLAYIGLGSNVGRRSLNFLNAIDSISRTCGRVLNTSYLYRSEPVLVTDQPYFLNAAVEVETSLPPLQLLSALQAIEHGKPSLENRYGPRELDLDILLYGPDNIIPRSDKLQIPHERLQERDFVLKPLCDLGLGNFCLSDGQTIEQALQRVKMTTTARVCELNSNSKPEHSFALDDLSQTSHIMGILNVTPDSFSDGGQYIYLDDALARVKLMRDSGVSIIDIGGESTRPNAEYVSEQEELKRVLPIIEAIRGNEDFDNIAISIDTYKANVSRQALLKGANIVNDVSGGNDDILKVVSEFNAPIIIMHNRGNSQTMEKLAVYDDTVADVSQWLLERLEYALHNFGIPKWNVWIDPGFGFAKNPTQNFEILANLDHLVKLHNNLLVGTSRKRFLKGIARHDVDICTAATTAIAVSAGANIVRVHDVQKTADVVSVFRAMNKVKNETKYQH